MRRFLTFNVGLRPISDAGHAWETEYGDPDNQTDFEYLIKYSPLHNARVPAGTHQYPATMLTTGELPLSTVRAYS